MVTHQDILDRLSKINESLEECQCIHTGAQYEDDDDEVAMERAIAKADESLAALKLDIEIHCRRTGVAFV